jgi:hypothetical protein
MFVNVYNEISPKLICFVSFFKGANDNKDEKLDLSNADKNPFIEGWSYNELMTDSNEY